MGTWSSRTSQPKEIRTIYVTDKSTGLIYPLDWSDSYAQFLMELQELFPRTTKDWKLAQFRFFFVDATETTVCICNESTFAAIVPKHRVISPTVNLYYTVVESWIVR